MTNEEMMRPMWLKDATSEILIDAEQVTEAQAYNGMLTIEHKYQEHLHFKNMTDKAIMQYFWCSIANALNAPVLATEEVLDKLPSDAKLLGRLKDRYLRSGNEVYQTSFCNWKRSGTYMDEDWQIKSDNCPKTLEYLLQFTTEGVSVNA
jgi:hypothetical protein